MKIIIGALFALVSSAALANEIYIQQIGDNLALTISQTGTGNKIGDPSTTTTTPAILFGDAMTFSITQNGDFNTIAATIKGNTYTGAWVFNGNSNTVDLTCDATSGANCETVTVDITVNGNSNDFYVYIGENKIADNLVADFTIDGDGNVITANLDATNADITFTIDNSLSANGNIITIDQDDAGGVNGHSITYDLTGGGNTISITQSGLTDKTVDITSTANDGTVTITQTD